MKTTKKEMRKLRKLLKTAIEQMGGGIVEAVDTVGDAVGLVGDRVYNLGQAIAPHGSGSDIAKRAYDAYAALSVRLEEAVASFGRRIFRESASVAIEGHVTSRMVGNLLRLYRLAVMPSADEFVFSRRMPNHNESSVHHNVFVQAIDLNHIAKHFLILGVLTDATLPTDEFSRPSPLPMHLEHEKKESERLIDWSIKNNRIVYHPSPSELEGHALASPATNALDEADASIKAEWKKLYNESFAALLELPPADKDWCLRFVLKSVYEIDAYLAKKMMDAHGPGVEHGNAIRARIAEFTSNAE